MGVWISAWETENMGKIPYVSRGNLNAQGQPAMSTLFNLPPLFNCWAWRPLHFSWLVFFLLALEGAPPCSQGATLTKPGEEQVGSSLFLQYNGSDLTWMRNTRSFVLLALGLWLVDVFSAALQFWLHFRAARREWEYSWEQSPIPSFQLSTKTMRLCSPIPFSLASCWCFDFWTPEETMVWLQQEG